MIKLLFLLITVTSLVSCRKDKCSGDCGSITISGRVVDTSNLSGVANAPIKIYFRSGGPGVGNEENYESFEVYKRNISNLRFVIYPKAVLNIKLQNTSNDNFSYFTLGYRYSQTGIGRFDHTGPLRDTVLSVLTSANIYTRIFWSKTYSPGQTKYFSDSLICSNSRTNTYIVNY